MGVSGDCAMLGATCRRACVVWEQGRQHATRADDVRTYRACSARTPGALGRPPRKTARSRRCRSNERVGTARTRRAVCLDLQKLSAAAAEVSVRRAGRQWTYRTCSPWTPGALGRAPWRTARSRRCRSHERVREDGADTRAVFLDLRKSAAGATDGVGAFWSRRAPGYDMDDSPCEEVAPAVPGPQRCLECAQLAVPRGADATLDEGRLLAAVPRRARCTYGRQARRAHVRA